METEGKGRETRSARSTNLGLGFNVIFCCPLGRERSRQDYPHQQPARLNPAVTSSAPIRGGVFAYACVGTYLGGLTGGDSCWVWLGKGDKAALPSFLPGQFRRRRIRVSPRLPLPFFPPSQLGIRCCRQIALDHPLLDPARGRHSIALLSLYRLRDVEPPPSSPRSTWRVTVIPCLVPAFRHLTVLVCPKPFAMSLDTVGCRHGAPASFPLRLRVSHSAAAAALVAAFLPMALGHGGHEAENIPEGEAMTVDPIVRLRIAGLGRLTVHGC